MNDKFVEQADDEWRAKPMNCKEWHRKREKSERDEKKNGLEDIYDT